MEKNWAIVIGINGYRYLQPLHYAVRDAVAMFDYFMNEVRFDQVYYFTDNSSPIQQDYGPPLDSAPTYTTLRRFLRSRFEQPFLQAGDNLWFFFAGHGIRYEDRDYLMPLDGDPGEVEDTAIPISYVTERLRRSGADNVVLLIDACRNEGRRSGVGVGEEVQQGVVTLFSCSPHESSYEIEQLQQGAFTYTLLQGLRLQGEGNCATVERLDQYLRFYVPELNRRYNKPCQTPYATMEPAAKYYLILLPRQATLRDAETLKMEAYKAETAKSFELADQLWTRVLAVSPADSDAILGIRRLAQISLDPNLNRQQSNALWEPTTEGQRSTATASPSLPLGRRWLLRVAGIGGFGVGVTFLFRFLQNPKLPLAFSSKPGSASTATPSIQSAQLPIKPFKFNVITVNAQGKELSQKQSQGRFFEEDLGNGVKLEMVTLTGGTLNMGSPGGEKEREGNEEPQRYVTVKPLLIGRYTVTQVQWRTVAAFQRVERDIINSDPSHFKGDHRPVERVSWHDAVEFCARLSQKTGREYRLPTEAEWEYACRAGTTTPFHFGETITTDLANYRGTEWEYDGKTYSGSYGYGPTGIFLEHTNEIGKFPPNAFGLCDMHGNVWEWCLDHWHDTYENAPTDGSAWIEGGDSNYRLLRGGSWFDPPMLCRSAYRYKDDPGSKEDNNGFRIVCSSP